MPISAQVPLSGRRRSSGSQHQWPVRYPQLYDVTTYVRGFAAYIDTTRFSRLPKADKALVISYLPEFAIQLSVIGQNIRSTGVLTALPVRGSLAPKWTCLSFDV